MLLGSKRTNKKVCKCKSLKFLDRVGPPGLTIQDSGDSDLYRTLVAAKRRTASHSHKEFCTCAESLMIVDRSRI